MMVSDPQQFTSELIDAGADLITVHAEAPIHLHRTVHEIKNSGVKVGVAINPATSVLAIEDILPDLDQILIMSVNPGYASQQFIETSVAKISKMKKMLDKTGLPIELEVDGGIGPGTAKKVVEFAHKNKAHVQGEVGSLPEFESNDDTSLLTNPDIAKKFVEAGCVTVMYALESANDKILESMNKRVKKKYFTYVFSFNLF